MLELEVGVKQSNAIDCSVFICKFADFTSRGAILMFRSEHISYLWARMLHEIAVRRIAWTETSDMILEHISSGYEWFSLTNHPFLPSTSISVVKNGYLLESVFANGFVIDLFSFRKIAQLWACVFVASRSPRIILGHLIVRSLRPAISWAHYSPIRKPFYVSKFLWKVPKSSFRQFTRGIKNYCSRENPNFRFTISTKFYPLQVVFYSINAREYRRAYRFPRHV